MEPDGAEEAGLLEPLRIGWRRRPDPMVSRIWSGPTLSIIPRRIRPARALNCRNGRI